MVDKSLLTGCEGRSRGRGPGAGRSGGGDRETRVLVVSRSNSARSNGNGVAAAKEEGWSSDEEVLRSESAASLSRGRPRSERRKGGAKRSDMDIYCLHCNEDGHRWACISACCKMSLQRSPTLCVAFRWLAPIGFLAPTAGCLRCCCRVLTCPKLAGQSQDLKANLNQAYLGGRNSPSVETILKRMGLREAGPQSRRGEVGSADQARSSRGRRTEPAQDEQCLHCKEHGHRCAHMSSMCGQLPGTGRPLHVGERWCGGGRCSRWGLQRRCPAMLSRCCRVMKCPKLEGVSLDMKARLNEAYLGSGQRPPRLQPVLELIRQQGGGQHSNNGDAWSPDEALSSEGRRSEPMQEEHCYQCRQYGHRFAPVTYCYNLYANQFRYRNVQSRFAHETVCYRRCDACPELSSVPETIKADIIQALFRRRFAPARRILEQWQRQQQQEAEEAWGSPRQPLADATSGQARGDWDSPESDSAQGTPQSGHLAGHE